MNAITSLLTTSALIDGEVLTLIAVFGLKIPGQFHFVCYFGFLLAGWLICRPLIPSANRFVNACKWFVM